MRIKKRWRTFSTSTLLFSYLQMYTRHKTSSVNACVYLSTKVLISDEDPKPFLHISLKFPSFAMRFSNSGNSNCMLLSNSFIKLVFLKRKPSEPNRYSISITNIFYVCHIWRIQCTDGSCWTETTRRSWKWRVSTHIDKYKWV